jgi:hypothetical protein
MILGNNDCDIITPLDTQDEIVPAGSECKLKSACSILISMQHLTKAQKKQ